MNVTTVWAFFAALALLVLTGCDGGAVKSIPLPPTEIRTVTVDVPVPVPCVAASDIPIVPPKVGDQLTGDARRDLDTVSASALRLRSALNIAVALLGACTK